jgi:hypothetical protein
MVSIVTAPRSQQEFRRNIQLQAAANHLADDEIHEICRDLGHHWRHRTFTPAVTVRSCVHRALNGDHSIAAMLAGLAVGQGADETIPTDSAWCQARSRLPLDVSQELRNSSPDAHATVSDASPGRSSGTAGTCSLSTARPSRCPTSRNWSKRSAMRRQGMGPAASPPGGSRSLNSWASNASLKPTLAMNVLRSKKVGSARREVASIVLGHNLVWLLIHDAADAEGVPARDISFACAVKTAVSFSRALRLAVPLQRPGLRAKTLRMIASQRNHHPFGRVKPRMVKRDRRRYSYLKEPRPVARQRCLT